ncbi:hypothetical protein [Actinotalea fermentans]|uniref:Uncharacterized protein n=1 Tax=Actinotalea fermentans TaxID=43671 RepID=A0A511Z2B3_9CELL|nr:hypothetical protein [Actinotalea fermentans]GEN81589.1 hypothetical protein AFE02nite_33230 [Actinotalea fermentans]
MDDGEVARLCAAAAERIADARAELLAAARVEWHGPAAQRFGEAVEELLDELVRASRRLERGRALVVAARDGGGGCVSWRW